MKERLEKLLKNAYSPYYNFPVSAIVVTNDGKYFEGVNVENANGTSICAERNAIANAVANGYKKEDIKEIYIMLSSKEHGTPCFACRQVLQEFMAPNKKVISVNKDGEEKVFTIEELCPHPFDLGDK